MKTGFVYRWKNTINGKMYLGSHKGTVDDGYVGSGKIFERAVKKYGIESFVREILEDNIAEDLVYTREQYYLDEVDAANSREYYNVSPHAGGGFDHINKNKELKERCNKEASVRMKKYYEENEHPKGMKDKKHTNESNAKRSASNKKWTQENIEVSVYQFTFNGKLKKKHASITDAANSVNGSPSNIKYTCEGKFVSIYGYLWSYTDKIELVDFASTRGKKKVQTPDGIFESVTAVVKHYNFSSTTQVRHRCLSEKYEDWKYIEEE